MRPHIVLAAIALSTIATFPSLSQDKPAWPAEPKSFLGIKFGVPANESLPTCANSGTSPLSKSTEPICMVRYPAIVRVENAPGLGSVFVDELDGKAVAVEATVASYQIDGLVVALVAKYGITSDITKSDVQTMNGATHKKIEMKWVGVDVCIYFSNMGSHVDEGLLVVSTAPYRVASAAKRAQSKNKLADAF